MPSLLVERRYPFRNPHLLQLFSMNTPNGKKVGIALEEMGLEYEAHLVHIERGDQHTEEYRSIQPNGKIPALVDPDGPDGRTVVLMESGAILWYLAEKYDQLLPSDPIEKYEVLQWLFFQVGHVGTMFGQFGHFHRFAREACDHPYPVERYRKETERLLGVLEARLTGRSHLVAEQYTIADIATFPWVDGLLNFYEAGDLVGFSNFPNVAAWYERCISRPASIRGAMVCAP